MPVNAELKFSPEVTPFKINERHNPPNFAEEALTLFGDMGYEPSFKPLLDVFESVRSGGISIAPISIDQLRASEFLLASAQQIDTLQPGDMLSALSVVYRSGETNSYAVENMLPSRRARETGSAPDPLRPTLELALVEAIMQPDGTIIYQEQKVPRVEIIREYGRPGDMFDYKYKIVTRDQSGESTATMQASISPTMKESSRHVMSLIATVGQMLQRHEELQEALARGESGLPDRTGEEVLREEQQQVIKTLQAIAAGNGQEQSRALVPVTDVLAGLTPREREVIALRYGIGIEGGKTLNKAETARELKISPGRVGQLEEMALRKLMHTFRNVREGNEN